MIPKNLYLNKSVRISAIILCLFCCRCPLAASPLPLQLPLPAEDVILKDDSRLDKIISLDETGTSLQDLLKKLSSKELVFDADKSCAEQKIQARLKKRPLRTLMLSLAELLPGQWRLREDRSYVLEMKPTAVQKRTKWWRLYLEERERALAEMQQLVFNKFREVPYRRRATDPNPENSDLDIETEMGNEQDFLRSLPKSLQKDVSDRLLDFRFYNVSGEIPEGYYEETATVVSANTLPAASREMLEKNPAVRRFASKRNIDWDKLLLRFDNSGFAISASVALPNGEATSTHMLIVGRPPETLALWLDHKRLADAVDKAGKKAPANWKQLAAYQKSVVWKNAPPLRKPDIALRPRRADALKHLAQKADIEFISDYYSVLGRPLSKAEKSAPLAKPLAEELALLSVEQDTSYKKRSDNVYLFRSNRWYRDDNLEVPAKLLKQWYAPDKGIDPRTRRINFSVVPSLEQTRQQMDWMAEVTTELNLYQISNGLLYFCSEKEPMPVLEKKTTVQFPEGKPQEIIDMRDVFPFNNDVNRILHEYRTVRFYSSLDAPMRAAILENRLPLVSLTAAQKQEAFSLMSSAILTGQGALNSQTLLGLQTNAGRENLNFNNLPRLRLNVVNF